METKLVETRELSVRPGMSVISASVSEHRGRLILGLLTLILVFLLGFWGSPYFQVPKEPQRQESLTLSSLLTVC